MRQHLPSIRLLTATTVTALVASLAVALSTPATIVMDGQRVASDVAPVTTPSGAYLPLRAVAEAAGAETSFEAVTRIVTVRRGGETLRMRVGSRDAILDGHHITLAHAPFTVRGRMMVAGATITHAFGSTVSFDTRHDRVDLRTPGVVAPVGDAEP